MGTQQKISLHKEIQNNYYELEAILKTTFESTYNPIGQMHIKVVHFFYCNAHLCIMSFLWTPIMNNTDYQIGHWKLFIDR
jgi:hypothetical protein